MHAPILVLLHPLVVAPDANEAAAALCLANDADETLQVEMFVFAAQADAGDLHGQIFFRDGRYVALAVNFVGHRVDVVPFDKVLELGSRMREGVSQVSGRLPPEVIQRVVRQNFGRFRMCYEQGLSANPNLTGRVAVRFAISSDGSVATAQNGGSDLPDSKVVGCVVSAFYGVSFPKPENGIVTVTYPIMFSPG